MKAEKQLRKTIALLTVLLISCLVSAGCQVGETEIVFTASLTDEQVFSIDDKVCSLSEAKVFLTNYQNIYASIYEVDLWEHDFGDNSLEKYVKDLTISQLAQIISMDFLAQKQGIGLSEAEQKNVKKAAEKYYKSLSKEEINYMDVKQGTIEDLYHQYGLANKIYSHLIQGVNEEVSDDEARIMKAVQIIVKDKKTARQIQNQLKEGADFMTLASKYNEAGASESEITFGRGKLPKEVEAVAFRMENEEVSKSIASAEGYYFLKCINNFEQELTDEHKKEIVEERRKEAFDDVYNEFVKTLPSEYNEKLWEQVKIKISDKVTTKSFFEVYDEFCNW
jgi:foldase protein PrsA